MENTPNEQQNSASSELPTTEVAVQRASESGQEVIQQVPGTDAGNAETTLQAYAAESDEYVYVAGKLRPHFPTKGMEKEYDAAAQALNKAPRDYYSVFSYTEGQNQPYRYLAEQVSWILKVDDQDAYVLLPSTDKELDEFINTLNFNESDNLADDTITVAIGVLGSQAPASMSDSLPLRLVRCDHLYHFTTAELLSELSVQNTTTIAVSDVLNALIKKPNMGLADFERARNFIAYRYPTIYSNTLRDALPSNTQNRDEQFLENLELRYSDSAPGRTIVDIILTYQKNISGRQISYYASVDVTDKYPFLHSNLTDYVPTN